MAKRKERDAIIFLNEQMKLAGEVLSEWERGRLFESLRAYSIDRVEPDLTTESQLYRSIFAMMRSAQDKAIVKYEETCERNRRSAMKRRQNDDVCGGGEGSVIRLCPRIAQLRQKCETSLFVEERGRYIRLLVELNWT